MLLQDAITTSVVGSGYVRDRLSRDRDAWTAVLTYERKTQVSSVILTFT